MYKGVKISMAQHSQPLAPMFADLATGGLL
jgi:hypothetical protein